MSHNKKKQTEQQPDKMDQLLSMMAWLATEVKSMRQELDEVKANKASDKPKVIEPDSADAEEYEYDKKFRTPLNGASTDKREQPYKVIPIEAIRRDMSYQDPRYQWIKKIYRWIGKTFPNKQLATEYLERAQRNNPGTQFDIFPV